MKNSAERDRRHAIEVIERYLNELRDARPSVRLAKGRSAKGTQTVAAVVNAARIVFQREGHANLSMRKVAEEAGLVVGNVNYYFSSKRRLIEAMLHEEMIDYVEQHMRRFQKNRDAPLEILLNVVAFYVANARTSHQLFYQLWGFAGSGEDAKALLREMSRPIGRFVYYLVRAARPDLSDSRIRAIVLQIFSLEEGLKLMMGLSDPNEGALKSAERDFRNLVRKIVEDA